MRRPRGEGSIHHRKEGIWEGKLYVNLPDGSRVRRTVFGASAEQVERKLELLRHEGVEEVVVRLPPEVVDAYRAMAQTVPVSVERYVASLLIEAAR